MAKISIMNLGGTLELIVDEVNNTLTLKITYSNGSTKQIELPLEWR